MQGPLFKDGSFEFVCIPDKGKVSVHKYGTYLGRRGIPHSEYFPESRREKMSETHIHLDPEFETLTYGDPTPPKASLRKLDEGDYLIFYCGLRKRWQKESSPGLYLVAYFEVEMAGLATAFSKKTLMEEFGNNFHVRYPSVLKKQLDRLVLVKGGPGSRLLRRAKKISVLGKDKAGKPLKVLSPEMQSVFGDFGGHISIQRSPPRWIHPDHVETAIKYVKKLK